MLLIPPQEYRSFVVPMRKHRLPLTDSGGIQEELLSLGMPVLAMRDTTERPEGIAAGTVCLFGAYMQRIVAKVIRLVTDTDAYRRMSDAQDPYGDAHAAASSAARDSNLSIFEQGCHAAAP